MTTGYKECDQFSSIDARDKCVMRHKEQECERMPGPRRGQCLQRLYAFRMCGDIPDTYERAACRQHALMASGAPSVGDDDGVERRQLRAMTGGLWVGVAILVVLMVMAGLTLHQTIQTALAKAR